MASSDAGGEELAELIRRYEFQLLHGCGNQDCSEPLCFTGRSNISGRSIRRYTPRSAKVIAMSVCSGPKPRAHLCQHCVPSNAVALGLSLLELRDPSLPSQPLTDTKALKPRDESSLSQLLSDTKALQHLNISRSQRDAELAVRHQLLDQLLPSSTTNPSPNKDLVDKLFPCLDWLLDTLPEQRIAVWEMVDREIISKGFEAPSKSESRPSDSKFNTWIETLDALNNQPRLRLLERTLLVVGRRVKQEHIYDMQHPEDPNAAVRQKKQTYEVIDMLTLHLSNRGKSQPHIPLATIVWLKRLFAKTWDARPTVTRGSIAHVILEIFQSLENQNVIRSRDAFKVPLIRLRLADTDLASSWQRPDHTTSKHILNFQYLFSVNQLILCFRAVNLLRMSRANGDAMKVSEYRRRHSITRTSDLDQRQLPPQLQLQEEHYLLIYVSRVNLLKDTFDQLWQRRPSELRRPLRLRMDADQLDIGHDLGGVQVEFFNTVCKHIFSEEAQMFTTDPLTGLSYFTAGSLQPLHMFELFGLLLALAIYNGITLPIRLPLVLYHLISHRELPQPLEMIEDAWPMLAKSFGTLLNEYVEDMEYAFPLEANGVRLSCFGLSKRRSRLANGRSELLVSTVSSSSGESSTISDATEIEHAWPGWKLVVSKEEPKAVAPEDVKDYIEAYSDWLVLDSVWPQLDAFLHGFRSSQLFDQHTLLLLGPSNLKAYVEGTDILNIDELRAATRYDGYVATQRYITSFWRVVTSWPQEKQKLLLKFVTAAERIPISGASHLTFIIKKAQPENLDALPTSSTCFGTLMLPRYPSTEIMAAKLSLALKYGAEGFGAG